VPDRSADPGATKSILPRQSMYLGLAVRNFL
jgi:hypothetical protein